MTSMSNATKEIKNETNDITRHVSVCGWHMAMPL